MLRMEYFIGRVSTAMVENYLRDVRRELQNVIKVLLEMSEQLGKAVEDRKRSQGETSSLFEN